MLILPGSRRALRPLSIVTRDGCYGWALIVGRAHWLCQRTIDYIPTGCYHLEVLVRGVSHSELDHIRLQTEGEPPSTVA